MHTPFMMQVDHAGQVAFFDTPTGTFIEVAAVVGTPITLFAHIGLGVALGPAVFFGLVAGVVVATMFTSPGASLA